MQRFSVKTMHLKMSLVKWRPICIGPNVLKYLGLLHQFCIGRDALKGQVNFREMFYDKSNLI